MHSSRFKINTGMERQYLKFSHRLFDKILKDNFCIFHVNEFLKILGTPAVA